MGGIVTQVKRVNDLISEISAATEDQSRGISHASQAVSDLDQLTLVELVFLYPAFPFGSHKLSSAGAAGGGKALV